MQGFYIKPFSSKISLCFFVSDRIFFQAGAHWSRRSRQLSGNDLLRVARVQRNLFCTDQESEPQRGRYCKSRGAVKSLFSQMDGKHFHSGPATCVRARVCASHARCLLLRVYVWHRPTADLLSPFFFIFSLRAPTQLAPQQSSIQSEEMRLHSMRRLPALCTQRQALHNAEDAKKLSLLTHL